MVGEEETEGGGATTGTKVWSGDSIEEAEETKVWEEELRGFGVWFGWARVTKA